MWTCFEAEEHGQKAHILTWGLLLPEQNWHLAISSEANCKRVGKDCFSLPCDAGVLPPQIMMVALPWDEPPPGNRVVWACGHSS